MKSKALRLAPEVEEEPAMLMTSMIDVIFILLAFFVCVSEVRQGHLDVDLAETDAASTTAEASTQEPIVVEVTADDRVMIAGEAARTEADVGRLIAQAVERVGRDAPVHLKGDKAARNGTMMRVVGHLSKAGLKKIEFAVETGG